MRFTQPRIKVSSLKSTGLVNVAVSGLKLMQCEYMQSSQIYAKQATWCRVHPLFGKNQSLRFARESPTVIGVIKRHFLELRRDDTGGKKRKGRNNQKRMIMHVPK